MRVLEWVKEGESGRGCGDRIQESDCGEKKRTTREGEVREESQSRPVPTLGSMLPKGLGN